MRVNRREKQIAPASKRRWSLRAAFVGYRREEIVWAGILLAPALVLTLVFVVFPVVFSFYISFHKWSILTDPEWIGLENYITAFQSSDFQKALINNLRYLIGYIPLTLVGSLLVGLLLNADLRGRTLFRAVYFMPTIVSVIVIAEVWAWLYEPSYGVINHVLVNLLKLPRVEWLSDVNWAMPAIIVMMVWKAVGYYGVVFVAGLKAIDKEVYDAAVLDGATGWQQFHSITLPLLAPTTFFVATMLVIGAFEVFGPVFALTKGGPVQSTTVIVWEIYRNAFTYFKMGYASAMAYILAGIIFVVTLIQWFVWGRKADEQ